MRTPTCLDAVLLGRLHECDRLLPRPSRTPTETVTRVRWAEFCDPAGPWLPTCVEEWQERGGFRHRRAGLVLVAFRAGWLACCASVPEYHLAASIPALSTLDAMVDEHGRLRALSTTEVAVEPDADRWWQEMRAFFAPLAESLHTLGGPPPSSHEYWGNPVGLLGTVLWRLQRAGLPGDAVHSASELRAATGLPELLDLDREPPGPWARRRTCCQWWRRAGGGYCDECVLWSSRSRQPG